MQFGDGWDAVRNGAEELPPNATCFTPLSRKPFLVTDVRDASIVIEYREDGESEPLRRDGFEALLDRVTDAPDGFDFDRLPPNAEPYATVLTLHPHVRVDEQEGTMTHAETATASPLVDVGEGPPDPSVRTDREGANEAVSLGEMLSNMGSPQDEVECPITGCDYTNRSAESVAAHVSSSSTDKHIWAHTSYAGWRDLVRKHG